MGTWGADYVQFRDRKQASDHLIEKPDVFLHLLKRWIVAFPLAAQIEGDVKPREWRAQRVGDIGGELALPRNELFDSGSHCIEIANGQANLRPARFRSARRVV